MHNFILLDIKKWQDYTEPGDELDPGSPLRRTSRNLDDDTAESLPLPEGVLTTNLGLDVVVVITKTDYMSTLEKEQDYKCVLKNSLQRKSLVQILILHNFFISI